MTTNCRTLVWFPILASALIAGAWAAAPATAPTRAGADDTQATCLLKITSDPRVLPLDEPIVVLLLGSSGVGQQAAKDVLGAGHQMVEIKFEALGNRTSPTGGGGGMGGGGGGGFGGSAVAGERTIVLRPGGGGKGPTMATGMYGGGPAAVSVPVPPGEEQTLLGRLTVASPEGNAREIMTAVTQHFQEVLNKVGMEETDRLNSEMKTADKQVEEARNRIYTLQKERQAMLANVPVSDLSRDAILEMSRKLESERQDTALKIEALRARQEAIRQHMAAASTMPAGQKGAATGKLPSSAQQIQETLDELQKSLGRPGLDSKLVEAALQRAQHDMDDRKAELARAQSAGRLAELNNQMAGLSIDLTEAEARMKTLAQKCGEMRDLLARADDYEVQIGMELPLARSAYERARMRAEELQTRISSIRSPTVTVLGG